MVKIVDVHHVHNKRYFDMFEISIYMEKACHHYYLETSHVHYPAEAIKCIDPPEKKHLESVSEKSS